jgi:hypothetical protein
MKIVATQDGIAFVLTQMEQQRLTEITKLTDYTPRQVIECMAQIHASNFDEDVKAAIEALDEEALDTEAE